MTIRVLLAASLLATVGSLPGTARAVPKSLFVQAISVPTGDEAYLTRTWFKKVCDDHRAAGSSDYIYNLVLSEIADPQGNLVTPALDIIEDYYGCFDNVFVGTVNLPHADPYVTGMKNEQFRWDNINLSADVARAYETRFQQRFPGRFFHWYVSYEANLNYLASDVALKNAYAAFLLELSDQLTAIRPGAVLWSPAFWTPYASVPNRAALESALGDVLSTAPRVNWLHFQDFVGQAARKNCSTGRVTYGFDADDGIGYFGLLSRANPGTVVNLRVNMEHFVLGETGTCGTWHIEAGEPAELAAREAAYEAAGVPIGVSWEIRWWYRALYGAEGQACNQPEACGNGFDDDCDLQVDEGCASVDGGSPPADGGGASSDAGGPGSDAGGPGFDGGGPRLDGGEATADGGASADDAGSGDDRIAGGCDCATGGPGGSAFSLVLLAAAGVRRATRARARAR